jgi:hypothetical protein
MDVNEKIRIAKEKGLIKLDLSENQLIVLPEAIKELKKLQILDLDNRKFGFLGFFEEFIDKWDYKNQLTILPEWITFAKERKNAMSGMVAKKKSWFVEYGGLNHSEIHFVDFSERKDLRRGLKPHGWVYLTYKPP